MSDHEKYQFSYDERKEIFESVKEYFQLNREQRYQRRHQDLDPNDQGFIERWTKGNKFFNHKIRVQSWPDVLPEIDTSEMERIYLNQDYYQLLPFTNTLDYTKQVMAEYLNGDRVQIEGYYSELDDESIDESIDEVSLQSTSTMNHSSSSGVFTASSSQISSEERGEETFAEIELSHNNQVKSNDQIRISNRTRKTKSKDLTMSSTDKLDLAEKSATGLIKQRLVNRTRWLNEQAKLNQKSIKSIDVNSNYLNDLSDLDECDEGYHAIEDIRTGHKHFTRSHCNKSNNNREAEQPKKMNIQLSKSTVVRKYKKTSKKTVVNRTQSEKKIRKKLADLDSDLESDLDIDEMNSKENQIVIKPFTNPKIYLLTFLLSFLSLKLFMSSSS